MRRVLARLAVALFCTVLVTAAAAQTDLWAPARKLVGKWQGTVDGQAGTGTVEREYAYTLDSRFIRASNVSRYPVQARNPKGEVHEHVGMISLDRTARTLVLRQFHVEGFVNTYRQAATTSTGTLVFESESFENLPAAWRARETYEFRGDGEFTETFELAPPGKAYEVYSRSQFRRVLP